MIMKIAMIMITVKNDDHDDDDDDGDDHDDDLRVVAARSLVDRL